MASASAYQRVAGEPRQPAARRRSSRSDRAAAAGTSHRPRSPAHRRLPRTQQSDEKTCRRHSQNTPEHKLVSSDFNWLISCRLAVRREMPLAVFRPGRLASFVSCRLSVFPAICVLRAQIAAVAFGEHVLAQRFDAGARDDMRTDRGLHRDIEHLARNQLLHLVDQFAAALVGELSRCTMSDNASTASPLMSTSSFTSGAVWKAAERIVERGVAAAGRLQAVEEVQAPPRPAAVRIAATPDGPKTTFSSALRAFSLHSVSTAPTCSGGTRMLAVMIGSRSSSKCGPVGGSLVGLSTLIDRAIRQQNFVDHRWRAGDEVQVVFALQALLDDVHVQQPEKTAAKPESQRRRHFGFEM